MYASVYLLFCSRCTFLELVSRVVMRAASRSSPCWWLFICPVYVTETVRVCNFELRYIVFEALLESLKGVCWLYFLLEFFP